MATNEQRVEIVTQTLKDNWLDEDGEPTGVTRLARAVLDALDECGSHAKEGAMNEPQIIVYRDKEGDILVSLDGGTNSHYLTIYGLPTHHVEFVYVDPADREVWRSGHA